MRTSERQRAIREREVGGHDRVLGGDRPAGRADDIADLDRVGVLVHAATGLAQSEQVLQRVELGLAVEPNRGLDRERQRRLVDQ